MVVQSLLSLQSSFSPQFLFVISLTIFAILLCVMADSILPKLSHYMKDRREDDVLIFFNVIVCGTILWPLLFFAVFKHIDVCPWILVGLLWPVCLGILQIYDMYYNRCEEMHDVQERRGVMISGIHIDTSTVISFSFACATFFWAIGNVGNKEKLVPAARLILVVLLICIAFIVPTQHIVDNSQRYCLYIRALQRVAVNYTIGLLIASLIVVISNCAKVIQDPQLVQTSSVQV
jgi:hypothetical protein